MSKSFIPNPRQKQAIEHTTGPMLVLAGAGTGKTSVLTERIAFLIENKHALPEEILAITFTENAAQEMKARVQKRLGRKAAISASTFHAYCHGVLKRNGKAFHVLPPEDVYVFLRQRIDQLGLERFIRPADVGEFLYDLRNFFDRCHEELIDPEKFRAYVESLQPGQSEDLPRNCRSKDVEQLGQHEILARFHDLKQAPKGQVFVLWAVSPDHQFQRLGSIVNVHGRNEAEIESETAFDDFGLLLTTEDLNPQKTIIGPAGQRVGVIQIVP